MVNAQQWLDQNYPLEGTCIRKDEVKNWQVRVILNNYGKTRNQIIKLSISRQNLSGQLDLSSFPNLEVLYCYNNQLTKLILPNNNQIREIYAENNLLTTFDYHKFNPETLIYLSLDNNNLEPTNLNVFSRLVNLERLWIHNNKEQIEKGIANSFYGSLESLQSLTKLERLNLSNTQTKGNLEALKNLTKLEKLDISNTDINKGLEYLPDSLEYFSCSADKKENTKVKIIEQKLKNKTLGQWKTDWKKKRRRILGKLPQQAEDIQKNIRQILGGYSQQEITELKDPNRLGKYKWFIRVPQWSSRILLASGIGLLVAGGGIGESPFTIAGGATTVASSLIELLTSHFEKKYYEANENKWDRFVQDSRQLWNDYQELREAFELPNFLYKTNESIKKTWDQTKELEERRKKIIDSEIKKQNSESKIEDDEETKKIVKDLNKQIKALRSNNIGSEKDYYDFWILWEKINEVYEKVEKKENLLNKFFSWKNNSDEEEDLVTKDQFAQDLRKNWEERKEQWEEIVDILEQLNRTNGEYNNIDQFEITGEEIKKQFESLKKQVIDLKESNQKLVQELNQIRSKETNTENSQEVQKSTIVNQNQEKNNKQYHHAIDVDTIEEAVEIPLK